MSHGVICECAYATNRESTCSCGCFMVCYTTTSRVPLGTRAWPLTPACTRTCASTATHKYHKADTHTMIVAAEGMRMCSMTAGSSTMAWHSKMGRGCARYEERCSRGGACLHHAAKPALMNNTHANTHTNAAHKLTHCTQAAGVYRTQCVSYLAPKQGAQLCMLEHAASHCWLRHLQTCMQKQQLVLLCLFVPGTGNGMHPTIHTWAATHMLHLYNK